MKKIEIKNVV